MNKCFTAFDVMTFTGVGLAILSVSEKIKLILLGFDNEFENGRKHYVNKIKR